MTTSGGSFAIVRKASSPEAAVLTEKPGGLEEPREKPPRHRSVIDHKEFCRKWRYRGQWASIVHALQWTRTRSGSQGIIHSGSDKSARAREDR
jgi:hypothetical protein